MNKNFEHQELLLVEPDFSSRLTDIIIELDNLREKELGGTTHPTYFFELKEFFQMLESIGSARIEGNRTTVSDYLESERTEKTGSDNIIQIDNMREAMDFIDNTIEEGSSIDRFFIQHLHELVVKILDVSNKGEGDRTPGQYRTIQNKITKSSHITPDPVHVLDYMEELLNFINTVDPPKYDLIKIATTHHRFAWIHPFNNGNGRVVRLLTYAQLIKHGFNVKFGRIINPSAVFYSDRDKYYEMLSFADSGKESSILIWIEYVLEGLLEEIHKIDKLTDHSYLEKNILLPITKKLSDLNVINDLESKIIKKCFKHQLIRSGDLSEFLPGSNHIKRNRVLRKLVGKGLIKRENEKSRNYMISFSNYFFRRSLIDLLIENGFIFEL